MNQKAITFIVALALITGIGCKENEPDKINQSGNQMTSFEKEKKAILEVLNNETKAALNRDYQGWQEKWVHEKYVTKTYMNFADNTMTETLGWEAVNSFVKTYIEEHPEPAPLPKLLDQIDMRLYENGAWVNFEQEDAQQGLKRETRLMEKVNGQWKIAGMQTTIYGVKNKESK